MAAPFIASYFGKPLLKETIIFSALIPIANGLENPKLNIAKRDLNYSGIFKLMVVTKIVSFIVTITLAYYLKSHWALIYGTLLSYLAMSIGSYLVLPFIPKFSITKIKKQWDFSKWIFLKGIAGYSRSRADTFILAKTFSTSEVGLFNMAKEFAMIPYEQVSLPISTIIMTSVQKVQNSKEKVAAVIENYVTILSCILIPSAVGLSMLSAEIAVNVLGKQWLPAAPLLVALAYLGLATGITVVFSSALSSLNQTKLIFKIDIVTTIIIIAILLSSANLALADFSWIRTFAEFFTLLVYLFVVNFLVELKLRRLIFNLLPAIFASSLMSASLTISLSIFSDVTIINLILHLMVGVLSYSIFLWLALVRFSPRSESISLCKEHFETTFKNLFEKLTSKKTL